MGEDFSESVGEDISEQAGAIISESVGGFPRNQHLLAMLWTWQNAEADLSRITARTIVMPCDTDMYFTLEEARLEAAAIAGAELRLLTSPYGHCAGAPGRFPSETAIVEQAIRELLA
jgi:homoserine O-acetyltransferase